jgi:hypothetical protein
MLADNAAKIDTAQRYISGQQGGWEDLHTLSPNDAEALIYAQDQHILENSLPYFSQIVATSFVDDGQAVSKGTADDHVNGASRDLLRGASIAQTLYNQSHSSQQMLLIIANIPSPDSPQAVEEQIIEAQCQYHIVGVIGWPYGADTSQLSTAHIPVILPIPLSKNQQNLPFLFSVAPSLDNQAATTAAFANNSQVLTIYDKDDAYSVDLAHSQIFKHSSDLIGFDPGSSAFLDEVQNELNGNPNLNFLYFAGYPLEATNLLSFIENYQSQHPDRDITILGSNTLYQDVNCPSKVCPSDQFPDQFQNLYYIAFAFADERRIFSLPPSPFFSEFTTQFNPNRLAGPPYPNGDRPNGDAILAYDATATLAHALDMTLTASQGSRPFLEVVKNTQNLTGEVVTTLQKITVLGASGQISFNSDGSAHQKAFIILHDLSTGRQFQPPLFGSSYCGTVPHCNNDPIHMDPNEVL